ncbi:MAG: hypothetical protein KUA35_09335 [Pseudodesulfovibrio sp.]|nr:MULTISPECIES: hypothetical protein [Pseudodesulfovibrio]MBU4474822.1 hypothetical protein [Pseudomonadota bacterium]MBU4516308.1 hypothetical protein [Pseudomonadota bacterium]MBU4522489.1 hypothetical protein [Pseudomonadota bacterium]MBU4558689.1 hypothetical protein [Pseudomonadota bacterium]MBV1764257.1 hypothetical protein [Pseudodesulfovibrio sp.]
MSVQERQDALRWYARQTEEFRVNLMTNRFRLFCDLKAKQVDKDLALLEYAALCLVLKSEGFFAEKRYRSKKVLADSEIQLLRKRRTEKAQAIQLRTRKRGQVMERLAKKWGVVVELRENGLSFRDIAVYLKENHQLKVSCGYLHEKFVEWEKKE